MSMSLRKMFGSKKVFTLVEVVRKQLNTVTNHTYTTTRPYGVKHPVLGKHVASTLIYSNGLVLDDKTALLA